MERERKIKSKEKVDVNKGRYIIESEELGRGEQKNV